MPKDWFDSNDPPRLPDHGRSIPPMPLPTILDLGRLAFAACTRADLIDKLSDPPGADSSPVLLDREDALRSLLLTFRAKTLNDAATQLYYGFLVADDVGTHEMSPPEKRRCIALRRVFLSTLPLVAETAGLDLEELGAGYIAAYAAQEFPAEA